MPDGRANIGFGCILLLPFEDVRMASLAVTAPFGFTFDTVRLLRAYKALGVCTAQFYRNEKAPPTVAEALKASTDAGVPFDSIHGVFGPHLDPSGPDAVHREHCLKVYEDEGRLARDLGGPMVVVHPSAQAPDLKPWTLQQVQEQSLVRWPRLDEWLKRLAEIGERLGVVYLIENQPLNCALGHDPAALAAGIARANSNKIRMCLDTGHAHITSDTVSAVAACASVLSYIHIHDNDAVLDDHRMPGDGTIDWSAFAAALSASGNQSPRMFEVFYEEAKIEALAAAGFGKTLAKMCAV